METVNANNNKLSYEIIDDNRIIYTIKFTKNETNIEMLITEKSSLSSTYKTSLEVKNFHEINKFFKQFDDIQEIFEYFCDLEEITENTTITMKNKFAKLNIKLPSISKSKSNNNLLLQIPRIELNEKDLIVELCQQVKKIDILESKMNFLFLSLGKTEKDFYSFDNILKTNIKEIDLEKSKIIHQKDFKLISEGIYIKFQQSIKKVNLLYRATRDGDSSSSFHSKCNGKSYTVTFIKTKSGKKFGGFAYSSWYSNNQWISDSYVFVFSLDNNECYYYNSNGYMIYGHSSYGPYFGSGDIVISSGCLSNNSSYTSQSSFNYKGKNYALNGNSSFQVEDYEVYQLTLE